MKWCRPPPSPPRPPEVDPFEDGKRYLPPGAVFRYLDRDCVVVRYQAASYEWEEYRSPAMVFDYTDNTGQIRQRLVRQADLPGFIQVVLSWNSHLRSASGVRPLCFFCSRTFQAHAANACGHLWRMGPRVLPEDYWENDKYTRAMNGEYAPSNPTQ